MEHLVGAAEIAERLAEGHVRTVHSWRRRYPDFPAPVAKLRQALVWSWPDVQAWHLDRAAGRRPLHDETGS